MSEEKNSSLGVAIAEAAKAFAQTPLPYLLGMALIMSLPIFASHWDGHFHSQKGCFELQEICGTAYLVNTCTGEVKEYNPETEQRQGSIK